VKHNITPEIFHWLGKWPIRGRHLRREQMTLFGNNLSALRVILFAIDELVGIHGKVAHDG
jgi:hypothetical protein